MSSPVTVQVALMPSVIGCRGSVGFLRGRAVEPDDALAVVVDELQQGGVGDRAEPDSLVEEAVAALEDHDDYVVPVDDVGPDAAGILDDAHPEPAGVFEERGDPLVVLPEAAELVVVLARHVTRQDQGVQHLGHASASSRCDGTRLVT
jgi:hypothetical protein